MFNAVTGAFITAIPQSPVGAQVTEDSENSSPAGEASKKAKVNFKKGLQRLQYFTSKHTCTHAYQTHACTRELDSEKKASQTEK